MDIVGKTIQNGEPTPEHPVEIENKINILLAVDDENNSEKEYRLPFLTNIEQQAIETVLSELEKKDKEYEELTEASKELCKTVNLMKKVINEMAEYIDKITFVDEKEDYGCDFQLLTNVMCNHNNCKECIKEYFTNKVEREGN